MLILLLPLIFLGAGSCWWAQDNYRALWEHERNQIVVDNVGIRFGQETRKLLRWFDRFQERIDEWERLHHFVHRCAQLPNPWQAKCAAADAGFERNLSLWHRYAGVKLQSGWRLAERGVRNEARENGTSLSTFPTRLVLREKHCQRCHRVRRWDLAAPANGEAMRFFGSPRGGVLVQGATVIWMRDRNAVWNYRLLP